MPAEPKKLQILNALAARAALVKVDGGYSCNAGEQVFLQDTVPQHVEHGIALFPLPTERDDAPGNDQKAPMTSVTSGYRVELHSKVQDAAKAEAEALYREADLLKALFDPSDRRLGRLARNVLYASSETANVVEEGGIYVMAAVELDVQFILRYGDPTT